MAKSSAEQWLERAWMSDATDVHFDPEGDELVVRYRVAKSLREGARLKRSAGDVLIDELCQCVGLDVGASAPTGRRPMQLDGTDLLVAATMHLTLDGRRVSVRFASDLLPGLSDIGFSEEDVRSLQLLPFSVGIIAFEREASGMPPALDVVVRGLADGRRVIAVIGGDVSGLAGPGLARLQTSTAFTPVDAIRAALRADTDVFVISDPASAEMDPTLVQQLATTGHLVLVVAEADGGAEWGGPVVSRSGLQWTGAVSSAAASSPRAQALLHPHRSVGRD